MKTHSLPSNMQRLLKAAVLVPGMLLLAGCGGQEPEWPDMAYLTREAAPIKSNASVFPLAVGNRWVYRMSALNHSGTIVMAVTGTKRVGDVVGFVMTSFLNGKPVQSEVYAPLAREVVRLATGSSANVQVVPPAPMIRFPLNDGDTYDWHGRFLFPTGPTMGDLTAQITGPELVDTPAGSFHTWRLDTVTRVRAGGAEGKALLSMWLAPGVGMVKQELGIEGKGVTSVLQSYRVH
ncbi:MAG: hypothetical protein ACP5VE_15335 [Chthonomonadales bacterium]